MRDSSLNIQGGVLIIGSLLWQDNLGPGGNTIRKDWRDSQLDMASRILVNAPIRYGRLSGGGIYTMTFANSSRSKQGTAFFVPFRQNPISDYRQLLNEACELSNAEGMETGFIKSSNNIPWSVLGILYNDKKITVECKQKISVWWKEQIEIDPDYKFFDYRNFKLGTEKPCIFQNGQLNFPWITAVNNKEEARLNEFDFLIATATLPTNSKYPTITKMVSNVKIDNDRKYFMNNNRAGITTFQDDRILKKLS